MIIKKLLKKISDMGGNTLYYPGCLTRFAAPEIEKNYKAILNSLEVDYIQIPEFNCCGSPVINAGYEDDFYDLVKKNTELFQKYNIVRIISNCPACTSMFQNYYDIKAEHITQTIVRSLESVTTDFDEPISYHDPCHLGRGFSVYDEPRMILKKLGFEVVELANSGECSLCCGGGGGLRTNNLTLAKKVAKLRLRQCRTKKLVTTCPLCYKHLKENAEKIKVLELSEVLV